jgi:hypothetical protein
MGERGAWRPDARTTLGISVVAASLLMAGFAALFSSAASIKLLQPIATVPERLVFAAPPLPRPMPRQRAPALSRPAPIPLVEQPWPPLQPPISLPQAFTAQDYLKERAQQGAAALRDKVTGGDLRRDLGKVSDVPALRDNQSIPVSGGDTLVRSGDSCAQVHTVQGSPSPTNKINLAEPRASCPGVSDKDKGIGRALQDWAEKHRPPP